MAKKVQLVGMFFVIQEGLGQMKKLETNGFRGPPSWICLWNPTGFQLAAKDNARQVLLHWAYNLVKKSYSYNPTGG